MKTVKSIIVAVLVAGLMAVQAEARDQGVNGLVVGAGSGALVGQAIGRNTEGTLVGTAVGGMLGYIVGNEMDKQGNDTAYASDNGYASAQSAVYLPPPSPSPNLVLAFGGRHDRRHYGPIERCRDIVTVKCWHGRCREVIRTECRERDRHWRGDRYWRGDRHWRGDRYRHDDRHDRWRDRPRHRDRW